MSSLGEGVRPQLGVLAGTKASVCDRGQEFGFARGPCKKEVRNTGKRECSVFHNVAPFTPPVTTVFDSDLLMEIHEGTEIVVGVGYTGTIETAHVNSEAGPLNRRP